jgi:hypothetical protein
MEEMSRKIGNVLLQARWSGNGLHLVDAQVDASAGHAFRDSIFVWGVSGPREALDAASKDHWVLAHA